MISEIWRVIRKPDSKELVPPAAPPGARIRAKIFTNKDLASRAFIEALKIGAVNGAPGISFRRRLSKSAGNGFCVESGSWAERTPPGQITPHFLLAWFTGCL